jgi:hypothetical protein
LIAIEFYQIVEMYYNDLLVAAIETYVLLTQLYTVLYFQLLSIAVRYIEVGTKCFRRLLYFLNDHLVLGSDYK